jgi:hypothetical protein
LTIKTQKGSLKDNAGTTTRANIEYESSPISFVPEGRRAGVVIIRVARDDLQQLGEGDYEFIAEADGFFEPGKRIRLRNEGGRWGKIT